MNTETMSGDQVPLSAVPPAPPVAAEVVYPASIGVRFLHLWVDGVAAYFFAGAVGSVVWLVLGIELAVLIGGLAYIGYYFIFELAFGQTVAKMLTGTKVVSVGGEKPTVPALIGRSLARYIPFEVFSFLFYGSYPTKGWHDRLSGTLVVPKHLTPEQVRTIDQEKLGKGSGGTVVAIIIVAGFLIVAVIGILAAVMLAAIEEVRDIADEKLIEKNAVEMASSSEQLSPEVLTVLRTEAASYEVPQDMGDGVRLDRVFVERATKALTFEYTLVNEEVTNLDIATFADEVEAGLRSTYCEDSAEFSYYRTHGATLVWTYYDKNHDYIATVASKPEWCE